MNANIQLCPGIEFVSGTIDMINRMLGSGGFTHPRSINVEPGMAKGQLYNIKRDPLESNNLYFKHPEIVADLKYKLEEAKEAGYTREMK